MIYHQIHFLCLLKCYKFCVIDVFNVDKYKIGLDTMLESY